MESLPKVARRLVSEVLYGIAARQSVHLSEVGRALEEPIPPIKIETRLSRNLGRPELCGHIGAGVLREGGGRIRDRTLLILDTSDIAKPYAEKMQYLARVRDGSEGVIADGYWLCQVIGVENDNAIVPLYSALYSQKAPDFVSENAEIMGAMDQVAAATDGRRVWAIDRGGDRGVLYADLIAKKRAFVIRQKGDRLLLWGMQTTEGPQAPLAGHAQRNLTSPCTRVNSIYPETIGRDVDMKQVIQSARTGKLALKEVPAPKVRGGCLLVRTQASLISAGTERMVIDFARKSLAGKAKERPDLVRKVLDKARRDGLAATLKAVMARLDEPLPLGYSAAGTVMAVGAGLEGSFQVGQRVALAGAGLANHAELNVVPRNLVAPIPDDVADEEACFGTLAAIAMAGVRNLGAQLGDVVAVLGVGLVGQLAAQLLTLQGARVIAVDVDEARLALAKRTGAELTWRLDEAGLVEAAQALTGGLGCDSILVAAATESSGPLELAADLARDRARVVMVGKTGTEFPYAAFMKKELSLMVSRSYGPGRYDDDFEGRGVKYPAGWVRWTEAENLRECVRLMSPALPRRLDVGALISHRFPFDESEAAYRLVTEGGEPHLGVVLRYADETKPEMPRAFPTPKAAAGRCVLGVIGAGSFARTVLLPELKRIPGVELAAICTTRGQTAEHGQQVFGFGRATTEVDSVLADPAINSVLIATRHANHAELTARALAAGKSVLVEKPLALDRAQLAQVAAARETSAGFFCVGFNRRFAPMTVKARAHLARHPGPKMLVLRVNAGSLPAESWVNAAEEGGGRILGEVCHFVDLARALAGAPIATVQADAAAVRSGGCDDLTVTLGFADGSLATIVYTAQGDSAFSKERFECFAGGTVAAIDNFLSLSLTEGGRTRVEKGMGQDKGHRAELAAFAAAVASGGPAPTDEAELVETSLATIAVLDSLREGRRITL